MNLPSAMRRLRLAALIVVIGLLGSAARARAEFVFQASGTGSDGPLAAQAQFTVGSGTISVQLTNLEANPTSAGQELSGILFTLNTAPSSVSGAGTSGQLINVNSSNGTFTNVSGNPDRWEASGHITQPTTNSIQLLVLGGGQPSQMIIGPPDSNNLYSNANSSIDNFNPSVFETGTFNLNVGGVTTSTQITGATFLFGTGPDTRLVGQLQPPNVIPEPCTMALGLAGAVFGGGTFLSGAFLRRRRRLLAIA